MSLSTEQLEQLLVVQGRELEAQRRTIERAAARRREAERQVTALQEELAEARETVRRAYRKGYRAGWATGRGGAPLDAEPEQRARGDIRELLA